MSKATNALKQVTEQASKAIESSKAVIASVVNSKEQGYVAMATDCGTKLAEVNKLQNRAVELKNEVNTIIKALHDAKVTVGRVNKCAIAGAFHTALVDNGLSKGTANNYLTVFKEAVKEGKPVTEWNTQRAKAKAEKDKPQRAAATLATLLLKAFEFKDGKDFADVCNTVEKGFEDAKYESIHDGFLDYLEFNGLIEGDTTE